jgi:hypothetical protein
MNRLLIDVGSTYFKVSANGNISHYFRDFKTDIYSDLSSKCQNLIDQFSKDEIFICSSANGGLSTLIIGVTNSFSLKYASNIAYNSGINIIKTVLYKHIKTQSIPKDIIDVVIIVGGIDGVDNIFDENLISYLQKVQYKKIVYVGSNNCEKFISKNIKDVEFLGNVIDHKLQMQEDNLKEYLTNLYGENIIGKEDIKELYNITSNQIYSTPYIVNTSLPFIDTKLDVVDPFIVIDIGGATTDIHYSKELVKDNIITSNEYDRLVFKKLGVYKSRESLIFSAKHNEFVYELLAYLNTTENILEEQSEKSTKILMQLAIFLVLYKVSHQHKKYLDIKLCVLNSIVLTGGIIKVLSYDEIFQIVEFFYQKILQSNKTPQIIIDSDYSIWTIGMDKLC